MKPPFTIKQFFSIFEYYNHSVFPVQIILFVLAITIVLTMRSQHRFKNRFVSGFLGLLWLWTGIVYHIFFFSAINKAAFGFGGLFILQGLFFLWEGMIRDRLKFEMKGSVQHYLGYFFIIYGLVIYPIVGYFIGQDMARTISAGLPCPSVILTFGFLLLTDQKRPRYLLIIPSLWALIGISAVIHLKVYQDSMMFLAAIAGDVILFRRK